jgi:hypothetical protein
MGRTSVGNDVDPSWDVAKPKSWILVSGFGGLLFGLVVQP